MISFEERYRGVLRGILKEEQYSDLARQVKNIPATWYGVSFEKEALKVGEFSEKETSRKLTQLHKEIIEKNYVSARFPYTYFTVENELSFIKVYHPGRCGSSCSTSAPDPWWVFSRIPPTEQELARLRPPKQKNFISRLLGD